MNIFPIYDKLVSFVTICCLLFSTLPLDAHTTPIAESEVVIVGGGIAGALHAYQAHREALQQGTKARILIFEKNKSLSDTTTLNVVFSLTPDEIIAVIPRSDELLKKLNVAFNEPGGLNVCGINSCTTSANIVPSLTPDEILCVVPRGKDLVDKLQCSFNAPGGIRVDDVSNINDSDVAKRFISQVGTYSQDTTGFQDRTKTLLAMGKMSMDLWQKFYDEADAELKNILIASNYNPCREMSQSGSKLLHEGYRIDIIYNVANAAARAEDMIADYQSLGYQNCTLLSPSEVMEIDPFLKEFCEDHSKKNDDGALQWNNDSVALWRPGGCIDTKIFLPKFYDYLKRAMGTYVDNSGKTRDRFQILYEKEVKGLEFGQRNGKAIITGLDFGDGFIKKSSNECTHSSYVFCPGESVGTLNRLGLKEPAYAGFAGVSLFFSIPLPTDKIAEYKNFNHCMEVRQEGVVLAWQARFIDGKIFIGVAGTKAFYGDQKPSINHAFAKDRNLLQLNMVNDVLPEFISIALGKDTKDQKLTQADMDVLESKNIAKRWAGLRSVVYDGFPTLGTVYDAQGKEIDNGIVTTHLGSGGVSFGPAAVAISCSAKNSKGSKNPLVEKVLNFAKSNRNAD